MAKHYSCLPLQACIIRSHVSLREASNFIPHACDRHQHLSRRVRLLACLMLRSDPIPAYVRPACHVRFGLPQHYSQPHFATTVLPVARNTSRSRNHILDPTHDFNLCAGPAAPPKSLVSYSQFCLLHVSVLFNPNCSGKTTRS